jgi:hypothetical protein
MEAHVAMIAARNAKALYDEMQRHGFVAAVQRAFAAAPAELGAAALAAARSVR